jgi:glycosyltransferase involved in cell wall biosynthesis
MRLALNLEQLLHRPPGGIGRYTAELARLLPGPDPDGGERIEVIPFVARHRRAAIDTALGAFGLADLEPVPLLLPRPVLYDTWNVLGVPPLGLLHPALRDVDIVHAPSLAIPPRSGAPLIVTAHDAATLVHPETYPRRGRWFHNRGFEAVARRADLVIAPTRAAAEEILACTRVGRDRLRVVPHGVAQRRVSDGIVAATRATLGLGDDGSASVVADPNSRLTPALPKFEFLVFDRSRETNRFGTRGCPQASSPEITPRGQDSETQWMSFWRPGAVAGSVHSARRQSWPSGRRASSPWNPRLVFGTPPWGGAPTIMREPHPEQQIGTPGPAVGSTARG